MEGNGSNGNGNNKPRGSRGRQKIEMKKISNPDDLLISFSKRRSGIYKKASELITLCGAEIAVVVFSPSGKPFSFGHPSVEGVLNKFMMDEAPPLTLGANAVTDNIIEAHRRRRVAELSERHEGLFDDLDAQRATWKSLQTVSAGSYAGASGGPAWWEAPLDGLSEEELLERKRALAEMHAAVYAHVKQPPPPGGGPNAPEFLGAAASSSGNAGTSGVGGSGTHNG